MVVICTGGGGRFGYAGWIWTVNRIRVWLLEYFFVPLRAWLVEGEYRHKMPNYRALVLLSGFAIWYHSAPGRGGGWHTLISRVIFVPAAIPILLLFAIVS